MTLLNHTLHHLVVHRLVKDQHGPAQVELRPNLLPNNGATQRLIDQLCGHYAERLGKGYGRFEEDEDNFPMPRFIRQYAVEASIDFAALTQRMMQHLQLRAEQEQLASGGFVLIAHANNGTSDFLLVAILTEAIGTAITESLDVIDSPHLDLGNLRVAGRIDLTAWQMGAERYISFLKGRGDVAQYFKLFLGCNDVVIALKETQKLVQGLGRFMESQEMTPALRDDVMSRAHGYLEELGESGEGVSLDAMAERIWPDEPQKLRHVLEDETLELATGFIPDRRAIKPLVRFKASAPAWKVEFDRSSLRSGAVIYDKHQDSLVLYNVPEHLKQALLGE